MKSITSSNEIDFLKHTFDLLIISFRKGYTFYISSAIINKNNLLTLDYIFIFLPWQVGNSQYTKKAHANPEQGFFLWTLALIFVFSENKYGGKFNSTIVNIFSGINEKTFQVIIIVTLIAIKKYFLLDIKFLKIPTIWQI